MDVTEWNRTGFLHAPETWVSLFLWKVDDLT
jgi:hypothetical protein